jgi:hypothetical protein
MLTHNIINKITIIVIRAPKSKMAKGLARSAKNGYVRFNSIFVFLISYKFTAFLMKIMFGILK